MKKFIAVVTLLFAFTISASAQEKKAVAAPKEAVVSIEQAAKDDIAALVQKITLSESLKKNFYSLMVMKHERLSTPNLSAKEKEELAKVYEHKILAGVSPEQRKVLVADPVLMKKLSN